MADFAARYAAFRRSSAFFWGLVAFCAVWIGWNSTPGLPHFDDAGFERLTLILSIEASLQVAAIMRDGERKAQADRRQQKYMLDVTEATRDTAAAVKDSVEAIREMTAELHQRSEEP